MMDALRISRLRVGTGLLLLLGAAFVCGICPAEAQVTDYVIGPRDVLTVTVWDQVDLSGKYTVEADGSFSFPLIGRVKAAGLTLKQFEADLKKRLLDGQFFKDPQVSVAVDQYVSQRVYVVGEVRQPGPQPLTGDMTLIEALARAGSTLPSAGAEILIVHSAAGEAVAKATLPMQPGAGDPVRIDLRELQEKGLAKNVPLRDGDTIYVPRAETIYVFGQVKNPGAYSLQTKDTTILQALSLAGGVTDRGAANRIRIARIVNGKKVEIKVKALTEIVRPGDTIIVPERFF
jgi:polysaccharide export outer membrane protein